MAKQYKRRESGLIVANDSIEIPKAGDGIPRPWWSSPYIPTSARATNQIKFVGDPPQILFVDGQIVFNDECCCVTCTDCGLPSNVPVDIPGGWGNKCCSDCTSHFPNTYVCTWDPDYHFCTWRYITWSPGCGCDCGNDPDDPAIIVTLHIYDSVTPGRNPLQFPVKMVINVWYYSCYALPNRRHVLAVFRSSEIASCDDLFDTHNLALESENGTLQSDDPCTLGIGTPAIVYL